MSWPSPTSPQARACQPVAGFSKVFIRRLSARQILLISLSVVLAAALAFVVVGSAVPPQQSFRGTLRDLVPGAEGLPRWSLEYRPAAETAEMRKAVGEILNFDDAVYAIYTSADLRVSSYAAYWSPGRMSHRLIAGLTPDVCWVGGEWVKRNADSVTLEVEDGRQATTAGRLAATKLEERSREVGGQRVVPNLEARRREDESGFSPMEYREFQLGGQTEYMVFCHLVGGRSMSYGTGGLPPWYGFLGDLWARGFQQCEEQFFVRISSNRSLPEFQDAPPVQVFLQRLASELAAMRGASFRS